MVFASNEDEFNSLLAEMQDTLEGLDYQTVLDYDMECAKAQNDARVATVKQYEEEHGTDAAAEETADGSADDSAEADTSAEIDTAADSADTDEAEVTEAPEE